MAISVIRRFAPAAACFVGLLAALGAARAEAPAAAPPPLSLCDAVRLALEQNPAIIAARQDHGVAAAAVVVARAYPFNPLWEGRFRYAWPTSEGVTNAEPVESTVTLELEIRGQKTYRRAAAAAALSRTDWQIADQELALVVRVIRAFDTVVYRYHKYQLILDTIKLNETTAAGAEDLINAGKLRPADRIILNTEIQAAQALRGQARTALATASNELRAALGMVGPTNFVLAGDLNALPVPAGSIEVLEDAARQLRPDRLAREAAIAEADARLRLERANRFGNPVVGPTYEYDNSSIHNLGVQFALPLPVLNAHRGDIMQREAEKARAALDLRQIDVEITQDVEAALARLKQARAWSDDYEHNVRPKLEESLRQIRDLFKAGDPSVDSLRILDVQRKVLQAQDGYIDAQFEVRQAMADLAAALGDPSVAVGACPPAPCAP